jgi:hypothetical protein
MTSVSGHLTAVKFDDEYERSWDNPPPEALFDASVQVKVEDVCDHPSQAYFGQLIDLQLG